MHQPERSHGRSVFPKELGQPHVRVVGQRFSGAQKGSFISHRTGESNPQQRADDERFSVKGNQLAAGLAPGLGELPPNLIFMVASDKEDILARQLSQEVRTFLQGEHLFDPICHIEKVSNERQDIRTMHLHRLRQTPVEGFRLVQIRRGQDFYAGCHVDNIATSQFTNRTTVVDKGGDFVAASIAE